MTAYFFKLKRSQCSLFSPDSSLPPIHGTTVSSNPPPPPLRTLPVWGGRWDGSLHPSGACAAGPHSWRAVRSWCSVQRACTGTGGRYPTSWARPQASGTQMAPCSLPQPGLGLLVPALPPVQLLKPALLPVPKASGAACPPPAIYSYLSVT